MKKQPILIDCDTGTDDAIAIIAALYSPDLDVRAITTVAGNVALKYTSQNTLNLVRYLGFDTKVAVGAPKPIIGEVINSGDGTHGDTGMGTFVLPKTAGEFYPRNAVETIIEEARALNGELILVPIGPMTNIAHALMTYPELKTSVKEIVFMGGAMVGGNMTPTAEFNAWVDPEALSIVLNSGIRCKMIGLDVTEKAILNKADADYFRGLCTKGGHVVADILDFMLERFKKGGEDAYMHDGLAIAVTAVPDIVRTGRYYVDCECNGKYTRGHTYVAKNELLIKKGEKPELCDVALELDLFRFKEFLKGTVAKSARNISNSWRYLVNKNKIAQNIARETISELHNFVKVGMNEKEIEEKALELMTKKGSNSWWYHGLGALVLLGKRSIESMSGRDYIASEDNRVSENDVITIDLAPTVDGSWGDYARTLFVENGIIAEEDHPHNPLFRKGLEAELYLHNKLMEYAVPEMTYEELYFKLNAEITKLGFENLDFHGNLGHSIEFDQADRICIERGSIRSFKELEKPFTLEPHIRPSGSSFGFKRENIYYFDENGVLQLL